MMIVTIARRIGTIKTANEVRRAEIVVGGHCFTIKKEDGERISITTDNTVVVFPRASNKIIIGEANY